VYLLKKILRDNYTFFSEPLDNLDVHA